MRGIKSLFIVLAGCSRDDQAPIEAELTSANYPPTRNEQPFTRSGGQVPVTADQVVWIRAHFHPTGYGGIAYMGSVQEGFQARARARTLESLAQEILAAGR